MTMTRGTLIRYADICPRCNAVNSVRIDRSFKTSGNFRVAYGYCRECEIRVTVREINKISIK